MANGPVEDELPEVERPPSPPPHTTFASRGLHAPNFALFRPRDMRITNANGMTHVDWSCDGKKLAAVGVDKLVRIWQPEKSMDSRQNQILSGGHTEEIDYCSWNPTHPELLCTASGRDRRIVFWDARQTRPTQTLSLKFAPARTSYSPDGRVLLVVGTNNTVYIFGLRKNDDGKEAWAPYFDEGKQPSNLFGSTAIFNHAGDGIILTHNNQHTIRVYDFPALKALENAAAHVSGCSAAALDPRGHYLVSGGNDSIVNFFDTSEWICTRTIASCDHSVTCVSFSFDGEFIAIASQGSFIDICATETGALLHRVPTLAHSPTVCWHPSKYQFAFCGQTKTPPMAVVSLFGLGV
ncbi:unnamed protein product [Peniophora sp. CBMAI 1063]|nr:unnamed protein product [Peniophora sp. CBMAI 1063]